MNFKRLHIGFLLIAIGLPSLAFAQDSADSLRKELDDARNQLKAAQDRKNELATENEKLKTQLAAMQKDVDEVHRDEANWAENTYSTRALAAAWSVFLDRYPELKTEWKTFLAIGPIEPVNPLPTWSSTMIATTLPSTSPSTALSTTAPTSQSASAPTTTAVRSGQSAVGGGQ